MKLFHHFFERNVERFPDKKAIVLGAQSATYAQLDRMASRVAHALVDRGIVRGDRVAIYSEVSIEALAAVLGILKAGCVLVTVHHTFSQRKLLFQLKDSGARGLVTGISGDLEPIAEEAALKVILHTDPGLSSVGGRVADIRALDGPEVFEAGGDDDDARLGTLFYTSGSSARPKGVLVSHKNMVAAFQSVTGYLENTPDDAILSYSTLASDYGFYNILMPLLFGGRAVVEKQIPEKPEQILEVIRREEVTGMQVFPPVIFHVCQIEDLESQRIEPLRYISSSGQALPLKHIRRLRGAFPQVKIFSNYGLTECKRVAYLPPSEIDKRPGSVGKAIPGVRAFLVDDDGQLVTEPGRAGQLAVAGDLVMLRYWNLPEQTSKVLKDNLFGEERVLFTGDLFRTDQDGYLYYVCRKDDVFSRGGFKVNPREIEAHLLTHEAVAEVAVVPVADEAAGHVPKACVVLRAGAALSAEEVMQYCAASLDWHMVPTRVAFLDALPRTLSGKTSKRFQMDNDDPAESPQPANVNEYLANSAMIRLADHFHALATGRSQVPRQPVVTRIRDRIPDPRVLAYHDLLVGKTGPLFSHFLASVPCILEEMSHVGVALTRLSEERAQGSDRTFTFYEADAFDGSNGRTLAGFAGGRIQTLTSSPNKANEEHFHKFANPHLSKFISASCLQVDANSLVGHPDYGVFAQGVDYLYETAAFQFYGTDRDRQIGHVAKLLKPDGLGFFLEKLNHPDAEEYERRERAKDEKHKSFYFTPEEIAWKKQQMLAQMENGQVDFETLVASLGRHFQHVYLLWNSTNFYEFVASNDRDVIERFVALLGQPFIPEEFCFDKPVVRRVAGVSV
ncbi:class I adenylate-forming enzyme family protein [Stigmatella aurantiaca]|uniref:AMP-dependent synthetase and ligase n=1 Tax=Stigmatella aurantiaca (strain DW4/3-1) TaxID=378806 RepID=Q08Y42_STIAD|nr:class I adenylate-forming enzyme family protein [Stigmatella aurantiaca]ADO73038.1 AMP-dependent synthetase and ligase [Stigmatella aurantiaca DW4/3-1]EAU65407.1 AMP-dependent synthetase and ligase [Stigmatella aurantiaca DW4/3-1]